MNDKDWLQNLKIGDRVILSSGGLGRGDEIRQISRLTDNFIIIESKNLAGNIHIRKFRRKSGREAGEHGYHIAYLYEATKERLDAIALVSTCSKTRLLLDEKVDWNNVPLEILEHLQNIVKPYLKNNEKTNATTR